MNVSAPIFKDSRLYDASGAATAPGGSQMGKNEFLQLLVAEMSNQDPLNPAQGSEYVAQLAQFSSVEQLISLNNNIGAQGTSLAKLVQGIGGLGEGQDALLQQLQKGSGPSLLGATALIGKEVEAAGGRAVLDGSSAAFSVRVGAEAATGVLTIRDAEGRVVRRVEAKDLAAGTHEIAWDGLDGEGKKLPEGAYTATFEAADAAGKAVQAEAFTRGTITRVSTTAAGLTAWIGGLAVPVGMLTSVAS